MKKILVLIILFSIESAFARGTCYPINTNQVAYIPQLAQCGNKAAIVLSGKFFSSFSVVTRDCNSADRDPCYKHLGEKSCASNYSSPYKAIKQLRAKVKVDGVNKLGMVYCFRESGLGQIYQDLVRRITIKRKNPVTQPRDIVRLCLNNRSKATANVEVLSIIGKKNIGQTGYSAACVGQQYLSCDTSYCAICDSAKNNPSCN